MATTNDDNTGFTLALLGGGALVLWLLWRGRGKGGGGGAGRPDSRGPSELIVWALSGDRVALDRVDGPIVDLATMVARSRAAGAAGLFRTGDARHGWVLNVLGALQAAGVLVREGRVEATRPAAPLRPGG
jgi:hypothetical protein